MVKLVVEIILDNKTAEQILADKSDWFYKDMICVDEVYLHHDPRDDSFYAFKLVSMENIQA